MTLPLPDLLRTYGDLLRSQDSRALDALVWIAGGAVLLLLVFALGALVQALARWRTHAKARGPREAAGSDPSDAR